MTSVAQLGRWLAQQAEDAGVYILGETAGGKLLVDDGRVVGVRSGDKGRGRDGQELSNFEPGSDLIAKATVLCEGTAGPPDRRRDPPLRASAPRTRSSGSSA